MFEVVLIFGVSMLLLRDGLKHLKIKKKIRKRDFIKKLMNFQIFAGLLLSLISGYMFSDLLEGIPLSRAFPTLSLVYVVVVPLEVLFLDEPLSKNEIFGLILILIGSVMI